MSRSKRNWDYLVDDQGRYKPWAGGGSGAKGNKGIKGDQGPQGERGEKGVKGEEGKSIKGEKGSPSPVLSYQGEVTDESDLLSISASAGDVYYVINESALYVYTAGDDWLRLTNVTQPIKGEPGVKGQKGEEGPLGQKGTRGEKGDTGSDGIGLAGPKGDTGNKGEKGEEGSDGDKGEPGDDSPDLSSDLAALTVLVNQNKADLDLKMPLNINTLPDL